MMSTNLRKQGGASILTLPASIVKMLGIKIGDELILLFNEGELILRPANQQPRKRYSIDELLEGVTPQKMKKLQKEMAWAQEGKPIGREI